MPRSHEFIFAVPGGALTSLPSTGAFAFMLCWAISLNKRDHRARFGVLCAAIGFGVGQSYAGASTRDGAGFEPGELGASIGFAALIVALWFRWFKQRMESE